MFKASFQHLEDVVVVYRVKDALALAAALDQPGRAQGTELVAHCALGHAQRLSLIHI